VRTGEKEGENLLKPNEKGREFPAFFVSMVLPIGQQE